MSHTENDLRASELNRQAQTAYGQSQFAKAAELFEACRQAWLSIGNTVEAAEAQSNQSVAWLQAGDVTAALQTCIGTDTVFAEAGDSRRQAFALGNQAMILDAAGKLDEAEVCYQSCADLLKKIGDTENRSTTLRHLSALQLKRGKQLDAMATMDIALNGQKKLSLHERLLKKLLKIPFRMLGSS